MGRTVRHVSGLDDSGPGKPYLWILTEERPKVEVVRWIVRRYLADLNITALVDNLRIVPLLDEQRFTFTYEVLGVHSRKLAGIRLKTVSGSSSMVDYMLFTSAHEPRQDATPEYLIEETKTSDQESRNVAIFQRLTKFVVGQALFPDARCIMLYNAVDNPDVESPTSVFGRRLWATLGIETAHVATPRSDQVAPFGSVAELVNAKNTVAAGARSGNTAVRLTANEDTIVISAKLSKPGNGWADPNVGQVAGLASGLRGLGWEGDILVVDHQLSEGMMGDNKFTKVARNLRLGIAGLELPDPATTQPYWHYEKTGEKLVTIFLHLLLENFASAKLVFENHAGCERGYFTTPSGETLQVPKQEEGETFSIPDLVMLDVDRDTVVVAEGKVTQNLSAGLRALVTYDLFEKRFIAAHYPDCTSSRTVVLYGPVPTPSVVQVGFVLSADGELVLGIAAPPLFRDAFENFLSYYG